MSQVDIKLVLKLIRSHADNDELEYRKAAFELCNILDGQGEGELSSYIIAQLGLGNTFSPGGGELPTPEQIELQRQIDELKDAVWCSRGDVIRQNEAAKDRAELAEKRIIGIFESYANWKSTRVLERYQQNEQSN